MGWPGHWLTLHAATIMLLIMALGSGRLNDLKLSLAVEVLTFCSLGISLYTCVGHSQPAAVQLRVFRLSPFASLCLRYLRSASHCSPFHVLAECESVRVWDIISFVLQFPKSNWKIVAWPISCMCVSFVLWDLISCLVLLLLLLLNVSCNFSPAIASN